ncbi:MAG: prolipoprotein diacylglyceryl transferase [Elusimicrobiota bacterium]|nr:prolipoprotein diacylglyceryl transferase [Elusimicrobiota bacterium]
MHPILFKVGSFTLYTYGAMVALGLIAGYYLDLAGAKYRGFSREFIGKIIVGAIISGIIGARLFYVIIAPGPVNIFKIWEGGLVFSGGLVGGALWMIYAALRYRVSIWSLGDVLAPGLLLGQGIGRIGCFSAGCCYGKVTESAIGVVFSDPHSLAYPLGVPLIPTQLISSLYSVLAACVLFLCLKSEKSATEGSARGATEGSARGEVSGVFSLFLVLYGSFRIAIEYLRGDFRGPEFAGWTSTQWIAAAAVILGGCMLITRRKSKKSSESRKR